LGYDQSEYFMKRFVLLILALTVGEICAASLPPIQTVFIIMFENRNWSSVLGNTNAPYINSLLPMASYCQQYYTPPGNHPSEANYLWLEAGTNFGIFNDNPPAVNSQNTTNHFTTLLNNAGISWKTYQEGINGVQLPLYIDPANSYDPKHNPFLFFDDVTGTNDPNNAYGMAHERPFTELADDLASNTVASYNFLVPNLCDDGHDCPLSQADWWLSQQVPMILASAAYANNGAIFICWDEGNNNGDGPLGMIVLSRLADVVWGIPSSRTTPIAISEIMWKPAPRTDGKNLEFLELYNSNPWFQDISGYQADLRGHELHVPGRTRRFPAALFLVMAAMPSRSPLKRLWHHQCDGAIRGSLKHSETLQLLDEQSNVLLTVPYTDDVYPWPVATDGTGHSLVLANPTYGEGDPRAWDISDVAGGSPGQMDAFTPSPLAQRGHQ
jgi:hypothetical protein